MVPDGFIDVGIDVLIGNLIHAPRHLRFDGGRVDLIPSHLGLINVDLELAAKLSAASRRQAATNFLRLFTRLANGLRDEHVNGIYDVVIIDCPPNFNIVTQTAIVASDAYLVPAKPDYLSTLGIDQLNRSVEQLKSDCNGYQELLGREEYQSINPTMLGVVFTMVKYYAKAPIQDQHKHIAAVGRLRLPMLRQMIRENNRFYSRRTDGTLPLVLQRTSEAGFLEVRTELERLAAEVHGLLTALGREEEE